MKAKILILGLVCLFVFAYCESPANPEIEKALNPEPSDPPIDIYYSCEFELMVSHDASATGDFHLSLLEETPSDNEFLMDLGNLDFSPLLDNQDISEGTASFQATIPMVPSGIYNLCLQLAHYNDYEEGQSTPGEWVMKMIIFSPSGFFINGAVQEQRIRLRYVGRECWFTFSISD